MKNLSEVKPFNVGDWVIITEKARKTNKNSTWDKAFQVVKSDKFTYNDYGNNLYTYNFRSSYPGKSYIPNSDLLSKPVDLKEIDQFINSLNDII